MSILLISCKKKDHDNLPIVDNLIRAVDISTYPAIEQAGTVFYNTAGQAQDFLNVLKSSGINTIRLRLWVDPVDNFHGLDEVEIFSKRLRSKGFKVWLTLHYSDIWADPGNQIKPKPWENLNFDALNDSVYSYTSLVIKRIQPDYIQTGNEINNGLLFPEGNRWQNPQQFLALLQSASRAVRDLNDHTKIIVHFAGYEGSEYFYDLTQEIDYDIIGLSYYPLWHGKSLPELEASLNLLSNEYEKPVVLAETAYPFTLQWNDWTHNIVGLEEQLILPDFPASPQGQLDFLLALKNIHFRHPQNMIGFCYWGAELVAYKGPQAMDGSSWENQALFDFANKALPALDAFTSVE
ncbi:MAG: glycosyl hydrolase 53 family protein [Bacteroidales bacterium]|nr:glycosyl hydrolase 53 family protein [Bacteroidales bacterium]